MKSKRQCDEDRRFEYDKPDQKWGRIQYYLLQSILIVFCCLTLLGCKTTDVAWVNRVPSEQPPIALHGTIVNENGIRDGWVVFHRGIITAVETDADKLPLNARRISYDGYIFPGLIDTHNHVPWNVIPQWRANHVFSNRYEWQTNGAYLANVNFVFTNDIRKTTDNSLVYAAVKYGEVRAAIGGTTTIQSSFPGSEPHCLIRKLDTNYFADSRVPNIKLISTNELLRFTNGLNSGLTTRIFLHIAEGRPDDPTTTNEFAILKSKGLYRRGVVIIHGVGLSRPDFETMAKKGMYLVWSPKSNFVLYGETADILEALRDGVVVALAPDWTITGSDNVLAEMKVAWNYSHTNLHDALGPKDIFRMATVNAARVAGLNDFLGEIAPKYAADFFLAPKKDPDPYLSLLKTTPKDIHLVLVDGSPVYGDIDVMHQFVVTNAVDEIEVENVKKGIFTLGDPASDPHYSQHFSDIKDLLNGALPKLAPLVEN